MVYKLETARENAKSSHDPVVRARGLLAKVCKISVSSENSEHTKNNLVDADNIHTQFKNHVFY